MTKSEPQEDMDKLLNEYEVTSSNGFKWPSYHREVGCSKRDLRRCFIASFLCLTLVSVGWFLHVNVFIDKPTTPPNTVKNSILSGVEENLASVDWVGVVMKSGVLDNIDSSALVEYGMKHLPPTLVARFLTHTDDVKKGDFYKLLQDNQLMDEVWDSLKIPEDKPGPGKKKVDDYEYQNEVVTQRPNVEERKSNN